MYLPKFLYPKVVRIHLLGRLNHIYHRLLFRGNQISCYRRAMPCLTFQHHNYKYFKIHKTFFQSYQMIHLSPHRVPLQHQIQNPYILSVSPCWAQNLVPPCMEQGFPIKIHVKYDHFLYTFVPFLWLTLGLQHPKRNVQSHKELYQLLAKDRLNYQQVLDNAFRNETANCF